MATNQYSSQSANGYNSSPPADDGSEVASNQILWATIKTKLADVLKTFVEAVDAAVLAAFAKTINTDANEANQMAGSLAFADSELTIASGAITPTRTYHTVDTESDAASDDLDTMATGSVSDGAIVILTPNNTARTVVVKHEATAGAGDFHLQNGKDATLDSTDLSLVVQRRGADWCEISRSYLPSSLIQLTVETAVATTSGTTKDFTIPASVSRILVILDTVTGSGTDNQLVQLGDAGGVETSGYVANSDPSGSNVTSTAGFIIRTPSGAAVYGHMILTRVTGNVWISSHAANFANSGAPSGAGTKTLSEELTTVRLAWTGADTFVAGQATVIYEVPF